MRRPFVAGVAVGSVAALSVISLVLLVTCPSASQHISNTLFSRSSAASEKARATPALLPEESRPMSQAQSAAAKGKISWVLSAGANRGAIEIGALLALMSSGIRPDFLVGTSVGAINAVFFAADPTEKGLRTMAELWQQMHSKEVLPGSLLSRTWRFLTGADSLVEGNAVATYLARHLPAGVRRFGHLKIPVCVTAADLQTEALIRYGDDPAGPLVEALAASAAFPPFWPPVLLRGRQHVDGAFVADIPVATALHEGATTLYVIDLHPGSCTPILHGMTSISIRALEVMLHQQFLQDLRLALSTPGVTLYHLYLGDILPDLPINDFSHTTVLIGEGYQKTKAYLASPRPNRINGNAIVWETVSPPNGSVRSELLH
ncbi:patatin-like phospholipase family protein [Verrucomicrobium sp. 3C]|uniref:patatin-like phospholipase family protein n=1 Tax=Verrucomicrobium sp. 3C TaxID=1134055 RepID=UPI0003684CC3|nr:patatin-like phospholipase family protein [Verrucomicrobium sp. 3C]